MSLVWKIQQPSDPEGQLFTGGVGETMFRDLLIDQLSDQMSRTHQTGLADMLERQLNPSSEPSSVREDSALIRRNQMLTAYRKAAPSALISSPSISSPETASDLSKALGKGSIEDYDSTIRQAASTYSLSPNLIKSVIMAESSGNPLARSPKNAMGLMQIMPDTAKMLNLKNPWDPNENIMKGSQYLAKLLERFDQNEELALAAYNAGPGNVEKYQGIPPFPETQHYVTKVLNFKKSLE